MSLATAEQNTPEAVSGHGSSAHGAAGHGKKGLGNPILGMLLFIVSEIMFFGGLFAAYFSLRTSAAVWPPEGNEAFLLHEEALFPAIMTLLLLISSLTCQIAVWRIRRGDRSWDESSTHDDRDAWDRIPHRSGVRLHAARLRSG